MKKTYSDKILLLRIEAGIVIIAIIVAAAIIYGIYKDSTNTPVEEINNAKVDSIIVVNDSLRIKLDNIDSIKNENIRKAINLDDSASIELFKWLLSK